MIDTQVKEAIIFFAEFLNDYTADNNPIANAVPLFFAKKRLNYNDYELRAKIVKLFAALLSTYRKFIHMFKISNMDDSNRIFIESLNKKKFSFVV